MRGVIILNKSRLLGTVCAGLLSIAASPALASVVYSYDGNPFNTFSSTTSYDGSNFITGTITLENLLVANTTSTPTILDFSFTDGNQTLSMDNGVSIEEFVLTTDADGITDWKIDLSILPPTPLSVGDTTRIMKMFNWESDVQDTGIIQTVTTTLPFGPVWSTNFGKVLNAPGLWTGDVVATPLPATAWLFGSGLVGLVAAGRRRKK